MSRRIAPWRWFVALVGLSFGLGAMTVVVANMSGGGPSAGLILAGLALAALVILGFWLMGRYWSQIDEAAREAHKWAWYWGSNVALIPAVLGLVLLMRRPELTPPLWPGLEATPAHYMATGGFAVMLLLLIGYGVAWALWWFWKSR